MGKLKVLWDVMAEEDLRRILEYCEVQFGMFTAKKIYGLITDAVERLSDSPEIGKIESYGRNTELQYRSVVIHKQNKVIYSVHDEYIYIHMICNTRELPENYRLQLK